VRQGATIAIALLYAALTANAQETTETFKPNGKPIIRVFTNAHTTFTNETNAAAFEITRAYLGYEHHFSKELSGTAILDVADPGAGSLQMTAYLKNAFLSYRHNNLLVNFGMIPTTQFLVQENFWGNRYVEKVFQDAYGQNPSADLGASVSYQFSTVVSADLAIENGEGYKKIQSDDKFKTAIGLTINPVKELTIRTVVDVMGQGTSQQRTFAGFVGYQNKKLSWGAEYNYQKNYKFVSGQNFYGPSIYGAYKFSKKAKLYGRFDDLKSDKLPGETNPWNYGKDGQLLMLGFEYTAAPGIKLSPNIRSWNPENASIPSSTMLYLNFDIKF
jgi:hypothetical protein